MSTVRAPEPESEREMVISRLVQAPRRLVRQSFTSAEHLGRWWGPDGFRTTTSHFELRPGGRWVHVMQRPDGTDYPNQITWREVVPSERLTYLHFGDGGHTFESSNRARGARRRHARDDAGALPHTRRARAGGGALPRRPGRPSDAGPAGGALRFAGGGRPRRDLALRQGTRAHKPRKESRSCRGFG